MSGVRQFCRRPYLLLIGVCTLVSFVGCLQDSGSPSASEAKPLSAEPRQLSEEVKSVLRRKTLLVEKLAAEDRIVSAVRQANDTNEELTKAEIIARDARWRETAGIDDFIKPFLTNDCAEALIEFQEQHDAFPELLVTDSRGALVAASNKISDYDQADEAWWVATIDDGRGRSHTGPIEYDESARSEAISVYVPILDPQDDRAIGVIKAVCDVTAIKLEL
jgi:hypothetical protein